MPATKREPAENEMDATSLPQPNGSTLDSLFGGQLPFYQPTVGYRLNVDTLLLAHFAAMGLKCPPHNGRPRLRRVVDLGAGVGGASLVLARHVHVEDAILVDKNPDLLTLAAQNLCLSRIPGRVVEFDLTLGFPPELISAASLVLSNPPFFEAGDPSGTQGPARGSRNGDLVPFLAAAAACLDGPKSRAVFAYPARSLSELLQKSYSVGLVVKRLRLVHPRADDPARLVLAELRRARPGGLTVEPPLIEWSAIGVRSPELAQITSGQGVFGGPTSDQVLSAAPGVDQR